MRKLKLLMMACALMGVGQMWAQWTDVTSTYITNASLVADYYSTSTSSAWPVYTTGRTGNTQHPKSWYLHTNGTTNHNINTGTGFFECWAANQNVKRWTLFQDITLPAGTYRLTGQYSTNESRGIIKTVAITPHHSYFSTGITSSNWGNWGSETAEFTIYEETKVRVGMIANNFAQNHGFTLTTTGAKQLLKDVIDAAPASVSTSAAQDVYDDGGSDDAAYRSAAKTLHDAIVAYNIENASALSPVDMTDYITDPSFEGIANATPYTGNKHSLMSAWSSPSVSDGGARSLTGNDYLVTDNSEDGFYAVNLWNSSSTTYTLSQTISSLPVGRYVLTATYASDANNTATLSIGTTNATITATGKGHFVEGSATYDLTASADVTIQLSSSSWYKADNFRLSYLGDPLKAAKAELASKKAEAVSLLANTLYDNVVGTERTNLNTAKTATAASETVEAYETTIATVQAAIDAFTAAKTNYDALVTEIAKSKALGIADATADSYAATSSSTAATALTNTQNLKVAEYNYVTDTYEHGVELGSWTTTGPTGSLNGQHYENDSKSYLEQSSAAWNSGSWTIKYGQDVTLPAGNYVFKVAGRQAASDGVTLSLTVKNGETVLGTVNDFPRGDTGLGINTSGATDFTTGEGHTYVNGGAGRGWEWRYVKFTLDDDATVNVAVDAVATTSHMWVSFCDATVQTDEEANISLIAYNIALNEAITARDAAANKYVGGTDRSNLVAAINADGTLDKSDAKKIDAATATLNSTRETFLAGVSKWNAYTIAKNTSYADDQPYASAAKYAAIATAKTGSPNTASDAETIANAILSAYRQYVESNAMAEGVDGAENKTTLISDPDMDVTYDGTAHTFGAWQVFNQVDGTISLKTTSDQPLTDGDGNKYKYADIWKADNNGGIKQTIELPAGKYLLTVAGRAQNADGATFVLFAGDKNTPITRMGDTGGVFGNGWNDASLMFYVHETADVEIGVVSGNGKTMWWGATRFRLVRLGDAFESVTVSDAGFATYVSEYNLDFSKTTIKAYKVKVNENEKGKATLTQVEQVPANTPVLLYKKGGATENIPEIASASTVEGNDLVRGTGATVSTYETVSTTNDYTNMILNNGKYGIGFYFANDKTVATNRAYLHIASEYAPDAEAGSRMVMVFADETTGISSLTPSPSPKGEGSVYTLSGQRVEKPAKGLYIVNGKKVVIK